MPANVESMFYVREKPWHGLGTRIEEAPTSSDALVYAGLDWEVIQKNVYAEDGTLISGYKVNTRNTDNAALGIVSDRYKVVQNSDALYYRVVVIKAPLQGLCYTVKDAVDWLATPTTRWFLKGSNHSPLQFC